VVHHSRPDRDLSLSVLIAITISNGTPKFPIPLALQMFMVDMMCPLILESDEVSDELVCIVLCQLLPSIKLNRRVAFSLAKVIIEKCSSTLQPYVAKLIKLFISSKDM
jgi:hypothetical protein